jgi:hypothetical protein
MDSPSINFCGGEEWPDVHNFRISGNLAEQKPSLPQIFLINGVNCVRDVIDKCLVAVNENVDDAGQIDDKYAKFLVRHSGRMAPHDAG